METQKYISPYKDIVHGLHNQFPDIGLIHVIQGGINVGPDGKIIILPNGKTDLTGAWGNVRIMAEHGLLSWNNRTPGREKFVVTSEDAGKMAPRMRRHVPEVIHTDPETGLKTWRWVINEDWTPPSSDGSGGAEPELRQIVYLVKDIPNEHRRGELIDNFISEDDAILPASEYNPSDWDNFKWFLKDLYKKLFKPTYIEDRLFPNRTKK